MRAVDTSPSAVARALDGLRPTGAATAEAFARAVWSIATEPGDSVAGRLVSELGAVESLERVVRGDLRVDIGFSAGELRQGRARWMPRLETSGHCDAAFAHARAAGAVLVIEGDEHWPERVDDLDSHRPFALWVKGDPSALSPRRAAALVGARAATGYGEHVAADLAAELANDGVCIVSGAAYGIDGAAHRAALGTGGPTIALLAGGVDRPYPSGHADLLARIARTGAVVSETPAGTAPTKWRFLARNRLIAALGDATVVVEAGSRSGSLNTAAHAAALGRPLGAVPGPVTSSASAGCHRILRELGGICVTGPDDVRELIGETVAPQASTGPRTDDATRILDALSTRVPRDAAEIARAAGLSIAETEAALGLASLNGSVTPADGGWRRAAKGRP